MRHALESFIRRRFFVVHMVLLSVAALLTARTVSFVAGHVVAEKVKAAASAQPTHPRGPASRGGVSRDFEAASNANIFEGKREVVVEGPAVVETAAPPPGADTCEGAPKSSLRLRLVGTVVFSEPESSMASIVDEGQGGAAAGLYSINECVSVVTDPDDPNASLAAKPPPCSRVGDGAVLRRIEPERVCLWNETDHRMEYLAIDEPPEKGGVVARAPPKQEVAKPEEGEVGKDIRKVGENSYEVGQSEVDNALNNLAQLSTQARIVPAFEGGKTVGFKLFSIRPGSLYSKIGLQNGDVINRINGYEMSSPEKGLEIYTKLKDSKQVTVDLKRRGKPMTLDYNITP